MLFVLGHRCRGTEHLLESKADQQLVTDICSAHQAPLTGPLLSVLHWNRGFAPLQNAVAATLVHTQYLGAHYLFLMGSMHTTLPHWSQNAYTNPVPV